MDVEVFVFHDARDDRASERFVKWIDDHPDGYYINCKTAKKMMLHGSSCSGVSFRKRRNLAKNRKVCSLDGDGLVQWAATQSDEPLKFCTRCPGRDLGAAGIGWPDGQGVGHWQARRPAGSRRKSEG